jgi:hypothetical protein
LLAVDKFFKDIETQYDTKLGFESEKERLGLKIQTLKEERKKMLQILSAQPVIGSIIVKLLQLGFTENDILKMGEIYLNTLNNLLSRRPSQRNDTNPRHHDGNDY